MKLRAVKNLLTDIVGSFLGASFAICIFCLPFAISVLYLLFRAAILMYLWKWFVVPLGVIEISILHAAGLLVIKNLLTYKNNGKNTKPSLIFIEFVLSSLLSLGIGYLITLFM